MWEKIGTISLMEKNNKDVLIDMKKDKNILIDFWKCKD